MPPYSVSMLGGVHDGLGQPSAGGVELGALLALLHRGDAGFDRVEATYRMWRHDERAAAAWRAEIDEEKRRGAAITSYGASTDSDKPAETVATPTSAPLLPTPAGPTGPRFARPTTAQHDQQRPRRRQPHRITTGAHAAGTTKTP
jgi:hypothetical protein